MAFDPATLFVTHPTTRPVSILLPPTQIIRIKLKAILKPALLLYALSLVIHLVGQLVQVAPSELGVSINLIRTTIAYSYIALPCIFFGLYFGPSFGLAGTRLNRPLFNSSKSKRSLMSGFLFALSIGLVLGLLLHLFNVASPAAEQSKGIATLSTAAMTVFASAVTEELWFRVGMMSFIIWAVHRLFDHQEVMTGMIWTVIVFSAFAFGVAHLPQLLESGAESDLLIWGMILIKTATGILYAWCFWKKGLLAAVMAHFSVEFSVTLLPYLEF